jgi:hypothetical protein
VASPVRHRCSHVGSSDDQIRSEQVLLESRRADLSRGPLHYGLDAVGEPRGRRGTVKRKCPSQKVSGSPPLPGSTHQNSPSMSTSSTRFRVTCRTALPLDLTECAGHAAVPSRMRCGGAEVSRSALGAGSPRGTLGPRPLRRRDPSGQQLTQLEVASGRRLASAPRVADRSAGSEDAQLRGRALPTAELRACA